MWTWIKQLFADLKKEVQESNDEPYKTTIENLRIQLQDQESQIKTLSAEILDAKNSLEEARNTVKELEQRILKKEILLEQEERLEAFWNNKLPKSNVTYSARPAPTKDKNIPIDVRLFYNEDDSSIPKISAESNDEIAKQALAYVIQKIRYTSDTDQFKMNEMWLFSWETQFLKKGDCEDGSILLANILLKSGVPYWRVRLNAGDVKGGCHAWVTYLTEEDNEWVILDWCYFPGNDVRDLKKTWKEAEQEYFTIWFSWNKKYAFRKETFDRTNTKQK